MTTMFPPSSSSPVAPPGATGAPIGNGLTPPSPELQDKLAWSTNPEALIQDSAVTPTSRMVPDPSNQSPYAIDNTKPIFLFDREMPPRIKEFKDAVDNKDPLKVSDLTKKTNDETQNHHINEKPNWAKFFWELIGGDRSALGRAWTAYNGGPQWDEMGVDPAMKTRYAVRYNGNGKTGIAHELDMSKEGGLGRRLTNEEYNKIPIITNKDALDAQTANWKGLYNNAFLNSDTASDRWRKTLNYANAAEINARSLNYWSKQFQNQLKNSYVNAPVFDPNTHRPIIDKATGKPQVERMLTVDFIQSLPPEDQANIVKYLSEQNQFGTSESKGKETGFSGSLGNGQQAGQSANVGGSGEAALPGIGLKGSAGFGATTGANTQAQFNGREQASQNNGQSTATGRTSTQQSNIAATIMKHLGSAEDSANVANLIYTHNAMVQEYAQMHPDIKAMVPGLLDVTPDDLFTTGSKNLIEHSLLRQRNAEHVFGFLNHLTVESLKDPENIKDINMYKVQDAYRNSVKHKAIDDTFDEYINNNRGYGDKKRLKSGVIRYDPESRKLIRFNDNNVFEDYAPIKAE